VKKITIEDRGFKLRINQEDWPPIPTLHKHDRISLVFTMDVDVDALLDPVMCEPARAYLLMRWEEQLDQIIAKARKDIGD
jgi:hypothetical protein